MIKYLNTQMDSERVPQVTFSVEQRFEICIFFSGFLTSYGGTRQSSGR